ncbi:MAG: hypothetical protein KF754_06650 [Planctomycetes bacterium]|nr:hypothetical protein [Planctomycetota bacterium]
MSKPKVDLPSHFIALVFESSPSLRAAMMVKIVQFWAAYRGPELEFLLDSLRDTVAAYRASLAQPQADKRPLFSATAGTRAMALMLRVRHEFEELRNRCVRLAREAVFLETGLGGGALQWPSQRDPAPAVPANDREIEERKLPPADELWERLAAENRLPANYSPAVKKQTEEDKYVETLARAIVAGTVDGAKMDEIRAREEQKRGKEGWWAIESRVLDRAEQLIEIEERQMKAQGQQPQQPGK